ncbi:MAG: porin [Pseudomonadota bacterium]
MNLKNIAIVFAALFLLAINAFAGPKMEFGEGNTLELFQQVQVWDIATFDAVDSAGTSISPFNDLYIRRGRIGTKGKIFDDIFYLVSFAYDNLGKNSNTATSGTAQADNRLFYIWDALFTWKVNPSYANISIGYFRPQVGKESINSAFNVNSMVKALTNYYVRSHIVGRSVGRETGANIGGLHLGDAWSLDYNLGVFTSNQESITGEDGYSAYPLIASRVAFTIGDPEMEKYTMSYKSNYFGKRKGLTLGLNGSYQGPTDESYDDDSEYIGGFSHNEMAGADFLFNWGNLNLNGEFDLLFRTLNTSSYMDMVWVGRIGYNFMLPKNFILEPVVMYSQFIGDTNSVVYDGDHGVIDGGLNWYIKENNFKINLHYAYQYGEASSAYTADANTQKGNFLGLGVQLLY